MRHKNCILFSIIILLTACQPAPGSTSTLSQTPLTTVTLDSSPTQTPTPSATATATATKKPEPITSSNIDKLQLTGFKDLGFEYPLVFQRAIFNLSPEIEPGRYIAQQSQNNWGAGRWSPDGELLIVETSRGIDILNGHDLTLVSEYDGLTPIDLLSNGDLAALSGNQVVFLNVLDGRTTAKIELENRYASMAVSPDGSHLAYATGSQTFNLVNLDNGELREFEITRAYVPVSISDFAFAPDGSILFVTTPVIYGADVITLFAVDSGKRLYEIPAAYPVTHAPGTTYYVYWDKGVGIGNGYLAHPSGSADAQVVTATFPASIRIREGTRMSYDSYAMSFLSDTNTLGVLYVGYSDAYGPPNGMVYIWDLETMQTKSIFNLGYPYPFEFAFSPDGSRFFSVDFSGAIRIWDSTSGQPVASTDRYTFFWPGSLNPDGSQLVIPYYDHFNIVDRVTQRVLDTVVYPTYPEYSYSSTVPYDSRVTFLPDGLISFWVGYQAASPSIAQSMRHTYTYDTQEHTILTRFDYGKVWDSYYNCEFNEDGSIQVCQLTDNTEIQFIDVAEVRTGKSLLRMRANNIEHYALGRDGLTLTYCASGANYISMVAVPSSPVRQINFPCQDMVFLPGDERLLLSDGQIVDLATKTTVGQFEASWDEFPFVFFQADHNYAIFDTQVFDFQTGQLIGSLPTTSIIRDIAITPDDLTLIILTDRGLEYWQATPE
jgi:WD40 repeat protein